MLRIRSAHREEAQREKKDESIENWLYSFRKLTQHDLLKTQPKSR